MVTERMLAGVATREFTTVSEPIGDEQRSKARSTSKSAVSRRFVSGTRKALDELLHRDLSGVTPVVLMIDGIVFAGVTRVFGDRAVFQRCTVHKRRNVKGYLPKKTQDEIDPRLRAAFYNEDAVAGRLQADRLIRYPSAASSLAEGLNEMFTVRGLGVDGPLARSLISTNMIESMFTTVTSTSSNVKRWCDGEMRMRWIAAGLLEAEKSFNRVKGHRQLPDLTVAITRRIGSVTPTVYSKSQQQAA